MVTYIHENLRQIKTFPSLVKYLRDELDWPIETDDFEDLTFDYEPEELGIDYKIAAKIDEIKQLRPLVTNQPWGIFFIKFEPKRLPVVALRRILRSLVLKKRQSSRKSEIASWDLHDLLFISAYGEGDERQVTFAHFAESPENGSFPSLKVLGWDDADTVLHLDHVHKELRSKLHWPDDESDLEDWRHTWSSVFILRHREVITTSKELAIQLAELARAIRKRVNAILEVETEEGPTRKLMMAFKEALIHDLEDDDFADMYAQTIAYGLLSARIAHPSDFKSDHVEEMIPITNSFLKELMETFLNVEKINEEKNNFHPIDFDELGINEVVDLLNNSNMEAVLRDFGDKNPQEDPVIHFYELFLKEYDPKKRMQRGVFYTPRPVVSYIVRSVDELLRTEFSLEYGLADSTTWGEMAKRLTNLKMPDGVSPGDPFVRILDPAAGTGTFLVETIDIIHKTMIERWTAERHSDQMLSKLWNEYVSLHLLPRLYGFEIMMAPYAIAHMKMGLKLYETGYTFGTDERARVYLTNTLEGPEDLSDRFEFVIPAIAHEAESANQIKKFIPFTVIMGNPPYSVSSLNKSEFIEEEMEIYKKDVRNEKNIQPLSDDYIKFIRFAHWGIQRSSEGVIGLITNNSYLSGLIHRGMRGKLLETFDEIYILNLHGSSRIGEKTPQGGKDENVFDIQQGVAIALFTKLEKPQKEKKVNYAEFWGLRENKYEYLFGNDVQTTKCQEIKPVAPYYFFIPKDFALQSEYEQFWKITEIFKEWSSGIETGKDKKLVGFTPQEKIKIFLDIFNSKITSKDLEAFHDLKPTSGWRTEDRRKELLKQGEAFSKENVIPYAYRPFDTRFVYYFDFLRRAHREVMDHLKNDNMGLALMRRPIPIGLLSQILVVNTIADKNIYAYQTYFFPLYLYPDKLEKELFDRGKPKTKRIPNFTLDFLKSIKESHDEEPTPAEIFNYIYATLYSNIYRQKYAEFLKIDFPRIPFTKDHELFTVVGEYGKRLVDLHLLKSKELEPPIIKFRGVGDGKVEKVKYDRDRVHINKDQYFEIVKQEIWDYHIGRYQVCSKWLQYRKGRELSFEDINNYCRIVTSLQKTLEIQTSIDDIYPDLESNIIDFGRMT